MYLIFSKTYQCTLAKSPPVPGCASQEDIGPQNPEMNALISLFPILRNSDLIHRSLSILKIKLSCQRLLPNKNFPVRRTFRKIVLLDRLLDIPRVKVAFAPKSGAEWRYEILDLVKIVFRVNALIVVNFQIIFGLLDFALSLLIYVKIFRIKKNDNRVTPCTSCSLAIEVKSVQIQGKGHFCQLLLLTPLPVPTEIEILVLIEC